ncbi:MAG: alpha/beta hydrolase [Planctomycetota bacterium]|nr:MAG: alpha/beta hydrolase [Planctomycetota bacterium]REJ92188.1 MAG: alpha/beta hydrolase [Planctomycetota bacterium]REK26518.1 MAG: alpha/beta hydrolase [Planctomycetota bacterium]REK33971.1 MAG: alpha/beta hydrolase [Planctomycetota bacterium]
MPSLRSRLVRTWIRYSVKRLLASDAPIEEVRRGTDKLARYGFPPRSVSTDLIDINATPAERLTPQEAEPAGTILYLHGGGYCFGSITLYHELAARIAAASGATVILPEYRLAPEHPFPAALEDAEKVYQWTLDQGCSADRLAIVGDSAGGGLSLALAVTLRDAGRPLPAAIVCLSPWTDLACTGDSLRTRAEIDPMLPANRIQACAKQYAGNHDLRDPRISPLYADLTGLPPLLIHVGTDEVLLDDSTRLADAARNAGVDVACDVRDGLWHDWHLYAAVVPEGREAISEIAQFLSQRWTSDVTAPQTVAGQ